MKIILNHKCNFTKSEFLAYQEDFLKIKTSHDLVMCPSNIYLTLLSLPTVSLGAQNVSAYETGAHTGEVAASQLKELNVQYVLVGHSERRQDNKEEEATIKNKIENLLAQKITPILCIGETKEEKSKNETWKVLTEQLSILNDLKEENIMVAYEPVWAIGTGLLPTVSEIDEVLARIHHEYPNFTLLYGGSANDENIKDLKTSQYIEGYLLGGLSLNLEKLQVFLERC